MNRDAIYKLAKSVRALADLLYHSRLSEFPAIGMVAMLRLAKVSPELPHNSRLNSPHDEQEACGNLI